MQTRNEQCMVQSPIHNKHSILLNFVVKIKGIIAIMVCVKNCNVQDLFCNAI